MPLIDRYLLPPEVLDRLTTETPVKDGYIWNRFTPFIDVPTTKVIFEQADPTVENLAPFRAPDAEAEMFKSEDYVREGSAELGDWALKSFYRSSDVTNFRNTAQMIGMSTTIDMQRQQFAARVARDTVTRRQAIDNQLERLVTDSIFTGTCSYDDGKRKFSVNWGRPANQQTQTVTVMWDDSTANIIEDIKNVKRFMRDTHGVIITRALTSQRVLDQFANPDKFMLITGIVGGDPNYLTPGWGEEMARNIIQAQTGVAFEAYDSGLRVRNGDNYEINRFTDERDIVYMPDESAFTPTRDLGIRFGGMLTAPHVMNNMQTGYYSWQHEHEKDPWNSEVGTGLQAFPIFTEMELTYTQRVLA